MKSDVVYKGEQDGVDGKKVVPGVACLHPSCTQAGALASSNMLECTRSVKAARDLAESILIS